MERPIRGAATLHELTGRALLLRIMRRLDGIEDSLETLLQRVPDPREQLQALDDALAASRGRLEAALEAAATEHIAGATPAPTPPVPGASV